VKFESVAGYEIGMLLCVCVPLPRPLKIFCISLKCVQPRI
jgi:hypothetical protein